VNDRPTRWATSADRCHASGGPQWAHGCPLPTHLGALAVGRDRCRRRGRGGTGLGARIRHAGRARPTLRRAAPACSARHPSPTRYSTARARNASVSRRSMRPCSSAARWPTAHAWPRMTTTRRARPCRSARRRKSPTSRPGRARR
jgi:hypothetical protein